MKKTLRPYQQELLDSILDAIPNHGKICVQLSTGGGKTVIFTELIQQLNSKTLILVDSIDLVNQTFDTFQKQGIDIGMILAGNKVIPENQVIVAMVESFNKRINKIPKFDYCIVDECHVWIFNKVFNQLKGCKIIGFTATPSRLKRYKIDDEKTAQEVMADVYDVLICGKPIKWLIENKYLVEDENYLIDFDYSGLKTDSSGEFTLKSMKEVFQNIEYQKALRYTYLKYCDGKKTMLFTSCTETNLIYTNLFKDKNVRTYDSVNNKSSERDDVIEWFKNTTDGLLINTGVFTKGFDVSDVECIIVARATKSLALWIQICGRGARITDKIYKDKIIIIDGGNNISEHGTFSFERDWQKIFRDRKEKLIIEPQQECNFCQYTFPEKDSICPNCGEEVEMITGGEKEGKEKLYVINGQKAKLKTPTIDLNFFINHGKTKFEALKVLKQKWIYFLVKSQITKETWNNALITGQFNRRFNVLLKPYYLQIIQSILVEGKKVVYKNYVQKIIQSAFDKKYGNN